MVFGNLGLLGSISASVCEWPGMTISSECLIINSRDSKQTVNQVAKILL